MAGRIQDWSSRELSDEIGAALEEFAGPDRKLDDDELQIFTTWFHGDREICGGGTPAERYVARSDISADERAAASRIASASVGVHRVLAVEPGGSLQLEDIIDGEQVRVRSANVSRDAVRWDILIGRVMDGDPPSLWGPTRLLEPAEEPDLIAEIERFAGGGVPCTRDSAAQMFRAHALDLMRFRPPSWDVEPSFFTVEGDPVVEGSAVWSVRNAPGARERFRALGGLAPDDPLEIDITAKRDQLVAGRAELPRGALVIDAAPGGGLDTVSTATLRLAGEQLLAEAMSQERLDHAIAVVTEDFGELIEFRHREVVPIARRLDEQRATPHDDHPSAGLPAVEERRLLAEFMTERMRKWLDEPHPLLGGSTPRNAAAGAGHADVLMLVRGIENGVERARRDGQPFAEVAWMRDELGLADDLAA